jgi:hypothetical protein
LAGEILDEEVGDVGHKSLVIGGEVLGVDLEGGSEARGHFTVQGVHCLNHGCDLGRVGFEGELTPIDREGCRGDFRTVAAEGWRRAREEGGQEKGLAGAGGGGRTGSSTGYRLGGGHMIGGREARLWGRCGDRRKDGGGLGRALRGNGGINVGPLKAAGGEGAIWERVPGLFAVGAGDVGVAPLPGHGDGWIGRVNEDWADVAWVG